MDPPPPTAPVPAPTPELPSIRALWAAEARRFLHFVARPSLDQGPLPRPWAGAVIVFSLAVLVTVLVAVPILIVSSLIYEPPSLLEETSSFAELVLLAVILAPLLEEPAYRLWLSRRRGHVVVGCLFLLAWVGLVLGDGIDPLAVVAALSTLAVVALLVAALIAARTSRESFRPGHVPVLVWSISLAFGLIHLTNFDADTFDYGFWWLVPFIVAPQILSALVYSYARVRLGFWVAVLIHGGENLLISLLVLAE